MENTEMIKQLLEKIEALEKQVNDKGNSSEKQTSGKIYVTLTSLSHNLVLTTEERGKGQKIPKMKYGARRQLPFETVESILNVNNQEKMARNLRFIIDNDELIDRYLLRDVYDAIKPSTKEFENILACNKTRIKEIMGSASQPLRDALFRSAVDYYKRHEDAILDYNKIDVLKDYFESEKKLHDYFNR